MQRSRILVGIICLQFALMLALPARAGGLYANEYGTPESGTAGAGAEAMAMDASTAIPFYNPAGMTRLEGNQFILGAGVLAASAEFDPNDDLTSFSGGNGGQAAGPIPILTAAYVHSFTDRFKFGAALFAAAGAALEYDLDWVGRKQSQKSEIAALSLSPTLAYRISDHVSVGGGINIMATALLTQVEGLLDDRTIEIDGTDTQISYNLSWLFEPTEHTRIGLTWVSETEFDYAGDVTRTGGLVGPETAPVNTSLTLAQVLRIGLYQDLGPRAAILGTFGWEDWSALENQFITVDEGLTATIPRNWDDTNRYAVGFHYRVGDPWLLRFGVTYDTSPTGSLDRTADLPVDRQVRYGAGFQHEGSGRFGYGVDLVYADLGDAAIDSSSALGDLVGSYKSNEYIAATFNLQWRF